MTDTKPVTLTKQLGLSARPYLVSWFGPHDKKGDWPRHTRVNATTATRAIATFQRETLELWNDRYPPTDRLPKTWKPSDFVVVEAKVVA